MNENIKIFEELLKEAIGDRNCYQSLSTWIKDRTDFYTAPASTMFHGAYEGGLLEHSLNVYNRLINKAEADPFWKPLLSHLDKSSLTIISLLHDICKVNFYGVEMRNRKNDETGQWEKQPFYTVNDELPYGHGEKSVFLLMSAGLRLSVEEAMAIRWHMGAYEGPDNWRTLGNAMEKCPLIIALHQADMEATYLLEKNSKK
ncbi:enamine deaminase RidA (YjgF/YER057c/UK114 family) [Lachnospiraceae bacterium PF1-22]